MKKTYTNILIVFSAVLVVSCSGSGAKDQQAVAPKKALEVEGYKVVPEPFNNEIIITANLIPNENVELKSPISGQVLDIHFKEGEKTYKGQSIVHIDDRSWKAQLLGLNAQLDAANSDLDRKKALLEIEGSTQEEIETAFSLVESLKSSIKQLEINIDLANVTAPFSGQLGMRNFSKGAYLREGDVITTITEVSQLKVDFEVPQEHKASIKLGGTIKVVIEKDTLDAKIYAINPVIKESSRTISVRALLKQPSGKMIMPGTFAEVVIATNYLNDALMVPTQAIVPEINEQTVYVYSNGKAHRKTVKIGNRTDEKVNVISGIAAGDTLITTGLLLVKEGMGVNLQSVK
ncbi:MAG: efflux RND transporter periplasmic adaptor subunit [Chitinophagales bacterium]